MIVMFLFLVCNSCCLIMRFLVVIVRVWFRCCCLMSVFVVRVRNCWFGFWKFILVCCWFRIRLNWCGCRNVFIVSSFSLISVSLSVVMVFVLIFWRFRFVLIWFRFRKLRCGIVRMLFCVSWSGWLGCCWRLLIWCCLVNVFRCVC